MDAVVNFYKPPGMSSAQAVAFMKACTGMKAGHAGTLDSEAAGVLPILLGLATRLNDYLVTDKTYLAEIAFGAATDTQDAQGRVIARGESIPDAHMLEMVLPRFTGDIWQLPPQYSALKVGGKTAYRLARSGQIADLAERTVRVHEIKLIRALQNDAFLLRVRCGKGTYIRTLCHDIGQALACPAHMRFLLREQSAGLSLNDSATPDDIAQWTQAGMPYGEAWNFTMDAALGHLPALRVPSALRKPAVNGVKFAVSDLPGAEGLLVGACARVYLDDSLLGIYRREDQCISCSAMLRGAGA